ncbi:MAG TPA: protease complex subunit PrcB family protein [Longimicrobiales bacterium]
MERIVQETHSGIETRRREVITTEAAWRAFWAELTANRAPRPAAPAVDFDRERVIVAAMGRRPTGGYAIEIAGVYRTQDALTVVVVETRPGPGCITAQALTAPVYVARIAAGRLPVTFVERERVQECG